MKEYLCTIKKINMMDKTIAWVYSCLLYILFFFFYYLNLNAVCYQLQVKDYHTIYFSKLILASNKSAHEERESSVIDTVYIYVVISEYESFEKVSYVL